MNAKTEQPTTEKKRGDHFTEARTALAQIRRLEADAAGAAKRAQDKRTEILARCTPQARALVNAMLQLPAEHDGVLEPQAGDPDFDDPNDNEHVDD